MGDHHEIFRDSPTKQWYLQHFSNVRKKIVFQAYMQTCWNSVLNMNQALDYGAAL